MKIKDTGYRIIRIPFEVLSSNAFLYWLIGGWIIYYVLSAIWTEQAFGGFVKGIRENTLIQLPFTLFLISGYLNLIRVSKGVIRRGKLQFLGWILLPAGILLFFTGFFLSAYIRQYGQRIVGVGDIIKPPWGSISYRVDSIYPGLKESFLDIDPLGFFAYEPKLTLTDKFQNSFEVGAFPPAKIGDTYYHILNFGIAPGIRLLEGVIIRDIGYVPLRILVPGSSDYFEIPPYPYRFLVSMEPEKILQKRGVSTSRFNLKKPLYRVRVFKRERIIAEGDSRRGINFDGFTLRFFEPTFWVLLEIVRDPALPVIHIGIILITIGLPVSLVRFLFLKSLTS